MAKIATDDAAKKKIKSESIPALEKLLKDAKAVMKDISTLWDESTDAKLTAYPDPKAYRAKAQAVLASSKTLEESVLKFKASLFLGSGMYRGMGDVQVKATIVSGETFVHYYNALKIELNKL